MKMTARSSITVLVLALSFLTLVVCVAFAHDHSPDPARHDHLHHHHFAELSKVPEKARSRLNPLAGDPEAVPAGKKLFSQHCAECHGDTAEGGKKAPDLRAEEVQSATPGTLFWILTNGVVRRGMPIWSKLPEPERWQIVSFVKSLPPSTNAGLGGGRTHSRMEQNASNKGER